MMFKYLSYKIRALGYAIRSIRFYYFFQKLNVRIGQNLIVRGGRSRNTIGEKLTIYDNVIIEAHSEKAHLKIGDNCVLSYGVIISCAQEIVIGNDVWIGEYSSIRDSTHNFLSTSSLKDNKDILDDIQIGNNVWIGRNTIIMPGSRIGNNVIIGANSLVDGTCLDNSLYVGSPAVFKKKII